MVASSHKQTYTMIDAMEIHRETFTYIPIKNQVTKIVAVHGIYRIFDAKHAKYRETYEKQMKFLRFFASFSCGLRQKTEQ